MRLLWWTLLALVVAWALQATLGPDNAATGISAREWVTVAVLWIGLLLCLGGAFNERRGRLAWVLIAAGIGCWAIGDTIWLLRFGDQAVVPATSISDAFGLAWYPFTIVALALLVRDRVPRFELHRWIDGLIVMLFVITPWVALFLQPAFDSDASGNLDDVVEVAYVVGDAVLVGAVVGVWALMAWKPGRMWSLLGTGLAVIAIADAIYSTHVLTDTYRPGGDLDIAWCVGMILIVGAAWQPHPGHIEQHPVFGWRAVALPVAAQLLAIGIQTYGYFHELPSAERILTVTVLLIATIQIIVARPRAPG